MTRLLFFLTVIAIGLLAANRLAGNAPGDPRVTPEVAPEPAVAPPEPVAPRPAPVPPAPIVPPVDPGDRTPLIAQRARMEGRRLLDRSGQATYLDSLFANPDSVVRRWADRTTIQVALAGADSAPDGAAAAVRSSLGDWEALRLGIRFVESSDSASAEIVVAWVEALDAAPEQEGGGARTGLTELRTDHQGQIRSARVLLARTDGRGGMIGGAEMRAVASHEIGHALGLPHSGDRGDIMYPTVLVPGLSRRDRASAELLYALPPGPLRESRTR